jgi:hypothetical protein
VIKSPEEGYLFWEHWIWPNGVFKKI